jgi:Fe-Mn family superoxide dismutase
MTFRLPPLPWEPAALEPHISRDTIATHHGKHHRAYVDRLNALVKGTPRADWSLERIVQRSSGALMHQAAQAWNHEFYWHSLRPAGNGRPTGALRTAIDDSFGGLAGLQEAMTEAAREHFGSGWAWLVADAHGRLSVVDTHDADTPLREHLLPLLCCDVWEHAYYLDYRQDRAAYLKAFWHVVNWEFAAGNLARGEPYVSLATPRAARRAQPAERSAS